LKTKEEPSQKNLYLENNAVKSYWLNREAFELIDGVLYMMGDDEDKKLVLPTSLRDQALKINHDIPLAAHQGIDRTKARIKEKFYWYTLSRDVKNFVRSCEACNRNKKSDKYGKCPLTEFQAGAPMERVHIDFMGPLPKTPRGNEHILMMVDQFTKWVECVPLPSQSAEVTARAAVNTFFSRFGCPLQIHSDQGRNFEGKLFSAMCKVLEIHKTRTTPYRPASNGQAERYNRTLMDAVRCFIDGKQANWDLYLPQIASALRSSVNRSTGFTANKLMLGREVNTPSTLMFPMVGGKHSISVEDYVQNLQQEITKAHEVARSKLKTSLKRMKRNYDLRILTRTYEEGDAVYVLDTATIKGKCKKLTAPWKGPGVIEKKISAFIYRVKMKNSIFVTNHDRLKPCRDRQLPKWIQDWEKDLNDDNASSADKLYCLCRKPWNGRFMIACDFCDEWYHGACVNISPTEALEIPKYKCTPCKGNTRSDANT
jgi:transposase InsO family protein